MYSTKNRVKNACMNKKAPFLFYNANYQLVTFFAVTTITPLIRPNKTNKLTTKKIFAG